MAATEASTAPPADAATAAPDATAAPEASAEAEPPKPDAVELLFVSAKKRKGAAPVLLFDVTIRNSRQVPRYLLMPTQIHPSEGLMKGGVKAVELLEAKGDAASLTLGRFKGPGAFQAVLIPAQGEIKLEKLPIACEYKTPKECVLPLELMWATDFTIGAQKAAELLKGKDAPTGATVDVEAAKQVATKPITTKNEPPKLVDTTKIKLRFILSE